MKSSNPARILVAMASGLPLISSPAGGTDRFQQQQKRQQSHNLRMNT
jgi:hypothetical protein